MRELISRYHLVKCSSISYNDHDGVVELHFDDIQQLKKALDELIPPFLGFISNSENEWFKKTKIFLPALRICLILITNREGER